MIKNDKTQVSKNDNTQSFHLLILKVIILSFSSIFVSTKIGGKTQYMLKIHIYFHFCTFFYPEAHYP